MSRLSKAALITFVVATLAGSCLHFLYALWPNGLTALLAPVNESLWEHVKILYWPCLLSGVLLVRREPESLGARAFSLLLSAAVMLGVGYLYHVVLEGDSLFFDVALYVLVMAAFSCCPVSSALPSGAAHACSGWCWCWRWAPPPLYLPGARRMACCSGISPCPPFIRFPVEYEPFRP